MSSSSKATSAGNGLSLAFRLLSGRMVHDDLLRGCSNVSHSHLRGGFVLDGCGERDNIVWDFIVIIIVQ